MADRATYAAAVDYMNVEVVGRLVVHHNHCCRIAAAEGPSCMGQHVIVELGLVWKKKNFFFWGGGQIDQSGEPRLKAKWEKKKISPTCEYAW
jgi:hypothetical protein